VSIFCHGSIGWAAAILNLGIDVYNIYFKDDEENKKQAIKNPSAFENPKVWELFNE
jgi:hypothetical protein